MTIVKKHIGLAAAIALLSLTLGFTTAGQAVAQSMKPLLVQVLSTPLAPVFVRDVDAPANQPLQLELCFPPSSDNCETEGVGNRFNVPETTSTGQTVQRLVIEYASGTCFGGLEFFEVQLLTTVGGEPLVRHHLVPVIGLDGWTNIAQTTRIYADPGTEVRISGTTNGLGACAFALSGHLVVD
jgi:hypothetical protein